MAEKKQSLPAVPEYTKEELQKALGPLNGDQLQSILKKTPKNMLYTRPAKGGGEWTYVTGSYMKKMLNLVFGWDWDFEVVNFEVSMAAKQAIVHGKLTVRANGKQIVKHQFGRSDIAFKNKPATDENGKVITITDRNGKVKPKMEKSDEPLDLGNDLKAATTDALKKCASELGFASDIYAPNEFKEIQVLGDNKANNIEYWKQQLSEAIELCQDDGLADALRREALELQDSKATAEQYRKLLQKLKK